MNSIYKSRYGCDIESLDLVKWLKFLEDLGFINVGYEEVYDFVTKPITVHEKKSRADGWKLRILWSEDYGDFPQKLTYGIKLRLKISKEFLRPIKKGYFVLSSNGNVYVGDGEDEKLTKNIVEHEYYIDMSDEFMIMPLRNYKRYRFENVVISQGPSRIKVEKLHEWVKERGGVIPVVNLYLQTDNLHHTDYISVHSLSNFEFSILKLTLRCHFDELVKNPSVIHFPSAKSININVTTLLSSHLSKVEPSREYDTFLKFIFNNECINLDEIHFFDDIIDFTEEFVKGFIEKFLSTTNLEYAWKSVLIHNKPGQFWDWLQYNKEERQSIKCRKYFEKMINEWDNTLNKLGFLPSDGEINEEYIDRETVPLLWKPHVLEAENGWKLKILSSQRSLIGIQSYYWKFQIYK